MSKVEFFFDAVNATDDCEKLVTPAIVFIHKAEDKASIYWIGIGWWHFAITFAIGIKQ